MITLSRTEITWLINCVSRERRWHEQASVDDSLHPLVRAFNNLGAENMAALERKLVSIKESTAKRISIV